MGMAAPVVELGEKERKRSDFDAVLYTRECRENNNRALHPSP